MPPVTMHHASPKPISLFAVPRTENMTPPASPLSRARVDAVASASPLAERQPPSEQVKQIAKEKRPRPRMRKAVETEAAASTTEATDQDQEEGKGKGKKAKMWVPPLDDEGLAPPDIESVSVLDLCSSKYRFFGGRPMARPERKKRGRKQKVKQEVDAEAEAALATQEDLSDTPATQDPAILASQVSETTQAAVTLASVAPEPAEAYSGPRVRVVDGQIVVDQASLEVSQAPTDTDLQALERIEEHHGTKHITSASFMRRDAGGRWTADENERFYEGLRCWGTDFEMMARMFPGRTRHQIKLKYNREERQNPLRVDQALKERRTSQQVQDVMKKVKEMSQGNKPEEPEK